MQQLQSSLPEAVAEVEVLQPLAPEDELPTSAHSRRRRLLALVLAGILLAMALLAAGYSLFGPPPTPARTRPLPELIPSQGALR